MVSSSSSSAVGVLGLKMVIAAVAGMGAATICHPLDTIRVQMQMKDSPFSSAIQCAHHLFVTDGLVKGLYAGIGAAYLRQWMYGSFRIGVFTYLLEAAQNKNMAAGVDKNAIPFATKLFMGMTSGGIGSFVGTPSEVALVRMTADSQLPPADRRNYKNVADCLLRIVKEEGVANLWRGAQVTVLRAMVLAACVLAITSELKVKLIATGNLGPDGQAYNGIPLLLIATLISSFVANIFANPFDVIKSRTQNQKVSSYTRDDGKVSTMPKYKNMMDCFLQILKEEGVGTFWSGFGPAFIKLLPYNIVSLTLTEKITQAVTGKAAL